MYETTLVERFEKLIEEKLKAQQVIDSFVEEVRFLKEELADLKDDLKYKRESYDKLEDKFLAVCQELKSLKESPIGFIKVGKPLEFKSFGSLNLESPENEPNQSIENEWSFDKSITAHWLQNS